MPAAGDAAAGEVVKGDDTRLTDARTPAAHAASHQLGGSDAIKLDDLATPDDTTDLNATTGRHGLLAKLSGVSTEVLLGTGAWSALTASDVGADPAGTASSAVTTHESTYTHADIASNTADRHTIATVTGNGISLVGQEISLDIGTGATDVAAGNHLHTGVYDPAGSASAVAGDLTSHEGDTGNPHSVTAGQAGADPAGTAASAVGTHESTYTHADIASNTAARHTIATVTGNGISLVGQEISLDIGTGATDVAAGNHLHTGVYDPAGSASAVAGDLTSHEGDTGNPQA